LGENLKSRYLSPDSNLFLEHILIFVVVFSPTTWK